jgi:hypothetical protein
MKISLNKVRKVFYGGNDEALDFLLGELTEHQRSYIPEYGTDYELPGGSTEELAVVILHFLLNNPHYV